MLASAAVTSSRLATAAADVSAWRQEPVSPTAAATRPKRATIAALANLPLITIYCWFQLNYPGVTYITNNALLPARFVDGSVSRAAVHSAREQVQF
jgi:hypothetical protein